MATSRHGRQLVLLAVAAALVLLVENADAWQQPMCGKHYPCPTKPHAYGNCEGGKCVYTCQRYYENCDYNWDNGCEVYTSYDPNNCGQCHKRCQMGEKCQNGYCVIVKPRCPPRWGDCDGHGCKDLDNDIYNCGMCGKKCFPYKFGEVVCKYGECVPQCKQGWKYDNMKKCCVQGY